MEENNQDLKGSKTYLQLGNFAKTFRVSAKTFRVSVPSVREASDFFFLFCELVMPMTV